MKDPADDPHEYVMRLALAHVASSIVHALGTLSIVDHIASGLRTPAELARVTRTHEPSLLRLLRAGAALHLLAEDDEVRFTLTPFGEALRSDAPRHAAAVTLAMGKPGLWNAFGDLTRSIVTGEPALERTGGTKPFSDRVAEGTNAPTAQTMIAFYGDEPAAIVDAYDFASFGVVADIGGSTGNLLATILARHPAMRGILYDLPYTASAARELLARREVAERCEVISGSFFDSVPHGADVYILSHVIHDWPEERCERILANVREAMSTAGRLLVIEPLITPGHESDTTKLLDVIALAVTGGRHRTPDEHRALLMRTGFRVTRVIATTLGVSIIEAESR
jgi:hypothetical protein